MSRRALAERIALLKRLRCVGTGLLAGLILSTLVAGLVPAATAVTFGALVGGVAGPAMTLLLAYLTVVLLGHVLTTVREPLAYLARMRIDGAHRAEVARLAATSTTIGGLEGAGVQALIRQARADPESFMDGTPGPGTLAQVDILGRLTGIAGAAVVLAAFRWWLAPLLAVAAAGLQGLAQLEGRNWRRVWTGVLVPSQRADVWSEALVSPGEGKDLRIFGAAGWAVEQSQGYLRSAFDPMWPVGRRILVRQLCEIPLLFVPLAIAYLAVAGGGVPVATAAAVFAAAMSIYPADAHQAHQTINALTCVRAYDQLRAELTSAATTDPAVAEPPAGVPRIRFDDVSFGYPGTGRTVLDRLDLEIRPGELLGIVGLNGAGKSTLIKLLARLYEPTAGRITADGTDLAAIGAEAWRQRISIVFQDFVRYHLSAADNVALGNAAVPRDDAALAAAARDAGLTDVLARLPDGWQTPLARARTGGVDLSGGQWQQVVLARALYAVRTGARVLVLDEPTAHLDVRTEFAVFERLAAHRGDATVVLISHRLSTVRQADRIVLLGDGRIAESGSHDELMARRGRYAEMFTTQAQRFQESA
ncbi:ABC transporter ATP-binding protein [Paractinoplanes rishiriensis]|uniref:Multidrug ABC transporter permease n=1 Tax=Paractinoplanes rishiriensis TaxID=1050105 RepID=A0A919K4N8_9ACTN|nr:ATP-binding cassette domain-containing protein [Actinoplanes rishiriensis]GIE99242.1 multidrug ABC transporter permease [Actinoplanes rishiriensis]